MGIWGLTTFVRDRCIGKTFSLSNCRLVVDCYPLIYFLYGTHGLDMYYGGQFHMLWFALVDFFERLDKFSVTPVIVCDGSLDLELKLNTKVARVNNLIKNFNKGEQYNPSFSIDFSFSKVVAHVCSLRGVMFVACPGEADRNIALLSYYLDAPVLSLDSDFYIYNTTSGYVSFDGLCFADDESPYVGTLVTCKNVADLLSLKVSQLPLFAVLAGNDHAKIDRPGFLYVGSSLATSSYMRITKVSSVVRSSLDEDEAVSQLLPFMHAECASCIRELAKKSALLYDIRSTVDGRGPGELINDLLESTKAFLGERDTYPRVSEAASLKFIDSCSSFGLLSPHLRFSVRIGMNTLPFQVQNVAKESAHDVSLDLRTCCYNLIATYDKLQGKVVEFDRKDDKYVRKQTVSVAPLDKNYFYLDESSRLEFMLKALGFTSMPSGKFELFLDRTCDVDFTLVVCALRYVRKKEGKNYYPTGLIKCFLLAIIESMCQTSLLDSPKCHLFPPSQTKDLLRLLHLSGQYLSTMVTVDALNVLLNYPVQPFPFKYLYDGRVAVNTLLKYTNSPDGYIDEMVKELKLSKDELERLFGLCFTTTK